MKPAPLPVPPKPAIEVAAQIAELKTKSRENETALKEIKAAEPAPAVEEIAQLQHAAVLMAREHLEGRATLEQVEAIRRATSAKIDLAARAIQKRDGISYQKAVEILTARSQP